MDIESGHEEVYKPMMTKKHAPPESRASRRYALFLTATKVLCLLMVLSLLGYYVYVTVTMDDATAQLVRDVSKLQQHHHHRHNKTSNDDVPEWFTQVLNLTRKGFVHISLQPFPPPEPHRRHTPSTTTPSTTTKPATTTPTTTTSTTTTTVEPPTTISTSTTTESTPEDSTTESTTTTTETIDHDYNL